MAVPGRVGGVLPGGRVVAGGSCAGRAAVPACGLGRVGEHGQGGEDGGPGHDEGDLPAGHAGGRDGMDVGGAGKWWVLVPAGWQGWQVDRGRRGVGGRQGGPGVRRRGGTAKAAGAAVARSIAASAARTTVRLRMGADHGCGSWRLPGDRAGMVGG